MTFRARRGGAHQYWPAPCHPLPAARSAARRPPPAAAGQDANLLTSKYP